MSVRKRNPESKKGISLPKLPSRVRVFLVRMIKPFLESITPRPRYLADEKVKLEIRMANYRLAIPKTLGLWSAYLALPTLVGFIIANLSSSDTWQLVFVGFLILELAFIFQWGTAWLAYRQWRFLLTNKRIILITPDPDRSGFADVIYLKGGKIQVVDTDFSHNPLWGLFQIIRGARDVRLSMSGYEFKEKGAKVKGGLLFPDVAEEDIEKLEDVIFG